MFLHWLSKTLIRMSWMAFIAHKIKTQCNDDDNNKTFSKKIFFKSLFFLENTRESTQVGLDLSPQLYKY